MIYTGRKRKNARHRPKGRQLHVNKYFDVKGKKKPQTVSKTVSRTESGTVPEMENTTFSPIEQAIMQLRKTERFYPRQFEIWFAELGTHYGMSIQGGCRPVLIVSNDVANRHSQTLTVIPMTSRMKKLFLPTHVIISASDCTALKAESLQTSVLLAEQVITIDKSMLRSLLARLDNKEKINAVKTALDTQFWLEENNRSEENSGSEKHGVPKPEIEPVAQATTIESRGEHNGS